MKAFYRAEGYHQDYLFLNPNYPYIAMVDMPKLAAFKTTWPEMYADKPVLLAGR